MSKRTTQAVDQQLQKTAPASSLTRQQSAAKPPAQGLVQLLQKAATASPSTVWQDDELLDAIHWMRTVFALAAGLTWGLIPLQGLEAILAFLGLNLGSVFLWYRKQRLDEEAYGGHQALLTEGLAPSMALFVLLWTLVYTMMTS